jgi:hypothetical protein
MSRILELRGISKSFPGVKALRDVHLGVTEGETISGPRQFARVAPASLDIGRASRRAPNDPADQLPPPQAAGM